LQIPDQTVAKLENPHDLVNLAMNFAYIAAIAGVAAHWGVFIRGEWHLRTLQVLAAHCLLGCLSFLCFYIAHEPPLRAAWHTAVAGSLYLFSLFASIISYRLFFHPTRSFPGPKLAAISTFWHIYHIRDSKNFLFLQKLHEKYGEFVRTGPNEISICRPDAIQLLDGWGNDTIKDVWYDLMLPRNSAVFMRDRSDHKARRKAWSHSLSTKLMDAYHPRIVSLVHSLHDYIATQGSHEIDIDDMMSCFSFDVMGDVLFGDDFGLTGSQTLHPAIRHRDRALSLLGVTGDAIWISRMAFDLVPFLGIVKDWFRLVEFCDSRLKSRIQAGENKQRPDMSSWFIEEYQTLERSMDPQARFHLLSGSIISAVVAGSDTTRASMIVSVWYLAKYPEHTEKIRYEARDANISDANILAGLPHLNGFINEVLRMVPPAMTGNARMTGPAGLHAGQTFIPPGTKIVAPKYPIMRMESAFVDANTFIPERWYSRPDLVLDKRAFAPFSVGARQCVGKTLALVELRFMISALVQQYNIKFAPGYDPGLMWRDMKDQVTAQPGKVRCVFEQVE
jgi:cytochrome P450